MLNVNIWTAKIVKPLTKFVKQTLTLKPKSKDEYYTVGKFLIFKKVFLAVVLIICAGIFLYFTMFADPIETSPTTPSAALTGESFDYDDMAVKDFTGVANIHSSTGEVVYTGEISAGVAEGVGTLLDRDGNKVYEGEFAQNVYEGEGIKFYENGAVQYVGEFAGNLFEGDGSMYYPDGNIQYSGQFSGGEFNGTGELYNQEGTLLYTGNFLDGDYHAEGISYFEDGTRRYEGEFFESRPQGTGSLYSSTGMLIYTGVMYDGNIDYRSLLSADLSQIEAMFSETPRIMYSNTDTVYVYELAGVILTIDAKIQLHTTVNPNEEQQSSDLLYFMPTSSGGISDTIAGYTTLENTDNSLSLLNMSDTDDDTLPSFVGSEQELYFQIAGDVWQSEKDLDKTKISVTKVTIFGDDMPNIDGVREELFEHNTVTFIDDCVAIDYLRQNTPTLFSNIVFRTDTSNSAYVRISNIDYAGKIVKYARYVDDLTYIYSYQLSDDNTMYYYSVER